MTDSKRPPLEPLPPLVRPEGQPPVGKTAAGSWILELTVEEDGKIPVCFERAGRLVGIYGRAVVRHPKGNLAEPLEIVMRAEDAAELWPGLAGELGGSAWDLLPSSCRDAD